MSDRNELHVVFGTGPAGRTLAEELLARGRQVRLINRSGKGPAPAGAELAVGDATQPAVVRDLTRGAAAIYHCAHVPYSEWPEVLPRFQEIFERIGAMIGQPVQIHTVPRLEGQALGLFD